MKDVNETEYIPGDKHDLDAIRRIERAPFLDIMPLIPKILELLQDMNWPVARELAPFIIKNASKMTSEIRNIFATDDYIWQYWILSSIIYDLETNEIEKYRDILERLSVAASEEEKMEELDQVALEILEKIE